VIYLVLFAVGLGAAVFVALRLGRKRADRSQQSMKQTPHANALIAPRTALLAGIPLAALVVLLFVGRGFGWAAFARIAGLAFAGWVAWILLFSGKVRTATPEFRADLTHVLFVAFFATYSLAIALWLAAGAIVAVTGHSDELHARMHAIGGAPETLQVGADEIAPFTIDGSERIREMTFRAGSRAKIEFTNSPAASITPCEVACHGDGSDQGVPVEHNISIYRPNGEAIFKGERLAPVAEGTGTQKELRPAVIIYRFDAPAAGTYVYRCDVHPQVMHGSVAVLPADAVVTHSATARGFRDIARHIAEVSHQAEDTKAIGLDYAFSFVSLGLGVFLVLLRPRERMARVFGVAMVGTAAAYNLQSHAALSTAGSFDLLHFYLHPITGITYIYALVLFPDGKLFPQFSNRFVRVAYRIAFLIAAMVFLGFTGSILPDFSQHPAALVLTFALAIPVIGIVAQGFRLRSAPTSEARQQSRLLLLALAASFGLGVMLLAALGIDLRTLIHPNLADPTAISAADGRAFRVFQPLFVVIPLALFAGILRFRLWDIDLVIRRTIVYGVLAGFIGVTYIGVVVGLGGAFGVRTGLSIVATVLVAVAFDPLRTRIQRLANRLVFGERASPYEVMAGVAHRLAGMTSASEMLPAIAETVAGGVGAERARATLFLASGDRIHGSFPSDGEVPALYDRTIVLSHQGEPVGELAVGKRPGDQLRPSENRLLEAVGSQVATALHSLRLAERLRARLDELRRTTMQLEASRLRIVSAQDAERSRLERNIRDQVEAPLVAIAATISGAERSLARSKARTVAFLDEAAADANEVQDRLRDLARGVFPSLLADRGVAPALESMARKAGAPVTVRAVAVQDRFDPHSEAAVYFCCVEAIRSAARRAGDSLVEVELGLDGAWITFAVRDGAHGLSDAALTGAELQVMVDRIEAVGGRLEMHVSPEGTTVAGRVPGQPSAAAHTPASRAGSNADFGT